MFNHKISLSVPPSIELLFNNEKLELMKVLCLVHTFSVKSKKRRKVSEILFYYSLVNFDLIKLFDVGDEKQVGLSQSPNLYFRFQKKINGILLNMISLKFIIVHGDISKKIDDITVEITPMGKEFFEQQKSGFFSNLEELYRNAIDKVFFSAENLKVVRGVQQ